jgi:uncharacterized RDD family membrane protein YckC/ribosomal protein S27E
VCYDTAAMTVTCPRCGLQSIEEARYCARCGADLAAPSGAGGAPFPQSPPYPTGPAPSTSPARALAATHPAGFWIRVVAIMIDAFILFLAQGILFGAGWILVGGIGAGMAVKAAGQLFGSLIHAAYFITFHWLWGQTLGKMALQIRVVSMDGGPLTFGQSVGRYFAAILSAILLGIGFIMAGVRADKRGLHDLLAGTRVERL